MAGSLNIFGGSASSYYLCNMKNLLNAFEPITLDEMKSVKLMNRTDTKFVTNTSRLRQLLKMARQDYYVQDIDGQRNPDYDTTYLDTRTFDMYAQHQYGHTNRQKVRFRTYCCSNLQFIEVKTKNNHGRTKKNRIEVWDMDLNEVSKRLFLQQNLHYEVDTLQPVLNNHFNRITLVNKGMTERLTIDTALQFGNLTNGHHLDMGPLVVIELKRDGQVFSPILHMLRQLHIQPHGFSKYCMGSALTGHDYLPVNRFKCKLIEINKLIKQ